METQAVVSFTNVDLYQGEEPVLRNIHFTLSAAETCYLIGKSGSGKTTFLKAIYGSLPIRSGEAYVAGVDLHRLDRDNLPQLRRKLGMVFQNFLLFDDWTVQRNLSYILEATGWKERPRITARVLQVLEMVGLNGYESKKITTLSGGEQQRVVIARALLNNPPLIIADEPTGNLDPDTSDEILYLLNRLSREFGTSIIVATHDYRLIKKFPARVFRCEGGSITEID